MAKIQREFHYPKVYAVRCHVVAKSNKWEDGSGPDLNTISQPSVRTRVSPVGLEPALLNGHVEVPLVHLSQPLADMTTTSQSVTCWVAESIRMHQPDLGVFSRPQVREVLTATADVQVKRFSCGMGSPNLRPAELIPPPRVLSDRSLASRFPYRLRVIPFSSFSMKLQIRYRAQVLKTIGLKPNQVTFVGIVPSLPSAPLKMVDYETDDFDGFHYAFVARTGRFNSYLGNRIWVIIQLKGQPEYLPITAKEE